MPTATFVDLDSDDRWAVTDMFIVIAGDVITGFDFFGPFSNVKDANDFVSSYLGRGEVVRLKPGIDDRHLPPGVAADNHVDFY